MTPRAKIWLEVDGRYVFGLGIGEILKAVEATGSIKEAARHVGKSYRHVWARIKAIERDLGLPLVLTRVGGGESQRSTLSEEARILVRHFDELRSRVFELVEQQFEQTLAAIAATTARAKAERP